MNISKSDERILPEKYRFIVHFFIFCKHGKSMRLINFFTARKFYYFIIFFFKNIIYLDNCLYTTGRRCMNGACLDSQCYCNDGWGGKGCSMPDENECKYR